MESNDRQIYKNMTFEEKAKIVKDLRIIHPRFKKALELIKQCHNSSQISDDPQCALISGDSGSGKTTIFETYIKLNDKVVYDDFTGAKKAILWAEVPSPVRISTFLETMLDQLGDPFPTRGTIGNKNHRLVNLIKDCGVELIMLDEFQHFVHSENQKVNYEVADCFKSLINRTKVPVVLFGLKDAERPLEVNPQLKRRFSIRYSLSPFGLENDTRRREFQTLLGLIDKQLPFVELSGLDREEMVEKFYFATNGVINSIMKIIRSAAFYALEKDKDKIEINDFAKAYHLHSYILKGEKNNPFLNDDLSINVNMRMIAN
jgi:type II secretory pathway predicted ATPase ExeA